MPRIVPAAAMQPFSACAPGALIRLLWWNHPCLALRTARHGQPAVVCLEGAPAQGAAPQYGGLEDHRPVLTYGHQFTLEVDQGSARLFDAGAFWRRGVLIAAGAALLLRVGDEGSGVDRFYDWTTGLTTDDEPGYRYCAVFTRWSLALEGGPLLRFEALADAD